MYFEQILLNFEDKKIANTKNLKGEHFQLTTAHDPFQWLVVAEHAHILSCDCGNWLESTDMSCSM